MHFELLLRVGGGLVMRVRWEWLTWQIQKRWRRLVHGMEFFELPPIKYRKRRC